MITYWTETCTLSRAWAGWTAAAARYGGETPRRLIGSEAPLPTLEAVLLAVQTAWDLAIEGCRDTERTAWETTQAGMEPSARSAYPSLGCSPDPAPIRIDIRGHRILLAYGQGRTVATLALDVVPWASTTAPQATVSVLCERDDDSRQSAACREDAARAAMGTGEEIPGTDWRGPVALAQYLGEQIVYGYRRS